MHKPVLAKKRVLPRDGARGRVRPVTIKRFTGYDTQEWRRVVPSLKIGRYVLDERSVGGDAPKDFVFVYAYEGAPVLRDRPKTWPAYIAKVGHQYYPAESATEQLITRVGQLCGARVADSRLMVCAGQLRFLSRYFLRKDEILNHGAEILVGHLVDKPFVLGVAENRAEKDIFTFQAYRAALKATFPAQSNSIIRDFVRMIGFDALVGNQDRHFYNWGVITHTRGTVTPRFAPIYDTARGLFWNTQELGLTKLGRDDALRKYIDRSTPQIGWDGHVGDLNHFDLVERIAVLDSQCCDWLEELAGTAMASLNACLGMVDAEFAFLLSDQRRKLIQRCLELRFQKFAGIF